LGWYKRGVTSRNLNNDVLGKGWNIYRAKLQIRATDREPRESVTGPRGLCGSGCRASRDGAPRLSVPSARARTVNIVHYLYKFRSLLVDSESIPSITSKSYHNAGVSGRIRDYDEPTTAYPKMRWTFSEASIEKIVILCPGSRSSESFVSYDDFKGGR
jgi:hypothetical protein